MYVCKYLHIVHINLFQLTGVSHNTGISRNQNARYTGNRCTKIRIRWGLGVFSSWDFFGGAMSFIFNLHNHTLRDLLFRCIASAFVWRRRAFSWFGLSEASVVVCTGLSKIYCINESYLNSYWSTGPEQICIRTKYFVPVESIILDEIQKYFNQEDNTSHHCNSEPVISFRLYFFWWDFETQSPV